MGVPRPELMHKRSVKTEFGKISIIQVYKYRGELLKLYTNIPKIRVYRDDIIYVRNGKYRGNTYKVVDTFPGVAAYVWIRVSEDRRYNNDIVCLPITDIEVVERKPRPKPEIPRKNPLSLHIVKRIEKVRLDSRYDNWVADFRESYNDPLTPGEAYILRAVKKLIDSHDGDYCINFAYIVELKKIDLRQYFILKRIMFTVHSLIQKRRLEYIPVPKFRRYRRLVVISDAE